MKIVPLLICVFFYTSVLNAQKKPFEIQKNIRVEKIINSQWTFNYVPGESADKGYEASRFDDSKWSAISLPHTWNTYETTGEIHPFISNASKSENPYWWTGWGWYRKHFSINRDYSDRKVFIEFEGVQKYCKVWINGKYLGDHKGGYSSFDFDITQFIKPGEDNVLAVAVNNLQKDELKVPSVTAGNINIYGGIYRNVTLVLKDRLFIPMQGSASHEGGTFVTTPLVSENEGIVRVQTWVKNDNSQKKNCTLQTSILDATNKVVQIIKSEAIINPGQLYKFDQTTKPIKKPHLWSTEDPYLYKVYNEVINGKEVADAFISPLGFRWFRWDKNAFLYVNNKKMIANGGNYYQEYPWIGSAIPKWIIDMDNSDISGKKKNDFVTTAHYPGNKLVYELADRHGIVIDEEAPNLNDQGFSIEVREQQIKEMIRRDRNHPSIMFWSLGNETSQTSDSKFALAEDTTRIITQNRVSGDSAIASLNSTSDGHTIASQTDRAGEPARMVLNSSHKKIGADRGTVVILTADIVDSKGNRVKGTINTIKWTLSGPATLVGPAIYESDISKHPEMDGLPYMDMPVSNIIRSTGRPGHIHISVSASGLASGSFDVESEAIIPDNSIIIEPVLGDEGRNPVARLVLNANRLEDVPREIKFSDSEINLGTSDKPGYTRLIKDYILKNNPSLDTAIVEFKTLVDLFGTHLLNNNGRLMTDDYNFNVDHYNNCRLISGYVNGTKLPQLFKEGLKKYYANSIIKKGNEKNAGEEMNWLNWIPSGGTVVFVQNENVRTSLKGAVLTKYTGLFDIISVVYPQFVNFSKEARDRALIFISKMNPYVHIHPTNGQSMEGAKGNIANTSYIAEKGQPILIPFLKFISE
jgi:hypothetical protein